MDFLLECKLYKDTKIRIIRWYGMAEIEDDSKL